MARNITRLTPEINSGSMADIAFLLLLFFLVTTTIASDKGLYLPLPPDPDQLERSPEMIRERNLFTIRINSKDRLLVEGELMENEQELRNRINDFVLNYGRDPLLSEDPGRAVISLKTDRGTSQSMFIAVLNEIQGAYYDIYARRAGVTNEQWRYLIDHLNEPDNKRLYTLGRGRDRQGKVEIPMNISIAEPTR